MSFSLALHITSVLVLTCYTGATICFASRGKRKLFFGQVALKVGALFHGFGAAILLGAGKEQPFTGDILYLLGFFVVSTYLWVSRKKGFSVFSFAVSALALFCLLSSTVFSHLAAPKGATFSSPLLLWSHVVPLLVAKVSILFALLSSFFYLWKDSMLKRKRELLLSDFGPGLAVLERFTLSAVRTAFISLSLIVLMGSVWALFLNRPIVQFDTAHWFTYLSWFLLSFLLYAKQTLHWSTVKVTRLTFASSCFLLLAFLVVILSSHHGGFHAT